MIGVTNFYFVFDLKSRICDVMIKRLGINKKTLVRKYKLSKRYVIRRRDASYVILFGDELGQDLGFSLPGIVSGCGGLLASCRFEIGSEGQ